MRLPRSSGILLHPTSLPGKFGIGDLGSEAYRFADFLADAGQKLWQMLPLGPTGFGDSPYQCFSAFAGNPLLISLEKIAEQGYLAKEELDELPSFPEHEVAYAWVHPYKRAKLKKAFQAFQTFGNTEDRLAFDSFCSANSWWLDDYALFMTLKEEFGEEEVWTSWDEGAARRNPDALRNYGQVLKDEIGLRKYWQFVFFSQLNELKRYCHRYGIRIVGDLPIYIAHDSADVWSHPELFQLDASGNPLVVSGVPPDYFSATGQLWGNPIYSWDELGKTGYQWWIQRLRAALTIFDVVRLDHFRGYEAYWEVQAGQPTAENGRWVKGPGGTLFEATLKSLGDVPAIAENLGVITPEVEALRERFGFPGMSVLQFAFGSDAQSASFRPHNYCRNLVAYTGTHDNDTTVGWWNGEGRTDSTRSDLEVRKEIAFARRYLGTDGREINWVFIRALLASVADVVLVPFQDVLGMGHEARMNLPASPTGNWRWRFTSEMLTPDVGPRLRDLTMAYDR